ncbi:SUMF1/EgtB/PvdO family nonheme iron enzyme [Nannocystis punicea]|uniref:SUMF1/EgtB/PvdO family nonheme iron enzyme n=1 Tax=Nannocystis punicea TaxID=2995304 RepID=A0ABY7HDC6_9BACT|nr:SUMF1/EgtB/PvdO family nonheme iron enzyme [Nannocystis poenicansa]WAS97272.1 SUMF1/EgtB/PvdO family nonheme iron enzyme [Nannocystis poenicansa]
MTRRWLGLVALLACAPHEHPREPQPECPAGMVAVDANLAVLPKVDRFCIDVTEVTTAAYGACVHAGACTPTVVGDVAECNLTRADRGDHPINCVEFEQASAYCSWLGKRLPTNDEWMLAARSRLANPWPWGAAPLDPSRVCVQADGTCPAGQHPAGASAEGVQDLAGNVAEWVAHGERQRLRGGSWRDPPLPDLANEANYYMAAADSGLRCVVAPFATVDAVDLDVWTPFVPGKAELPVLAAPAPRHAPTRPLANLALVQRIGGYGDAERWWPIGDDWLDGRDVQADVLQLPDALETAGLPEGLRDFIPIRRLGDDLLLMRGGWGSSLRFVAVERAGYKIRWQIAFANYGSTYEQFVAPRTFVAEIYGQQADAIIGFGLADGRELWRIAGGEQFKFTRASRLWTDGERGYVRGDRGLLAFDPTTGAILWSDVAVGEGCGVVARDGALVIEEPGPQGHRRLDPATGAELGRIGGGGERCVWDADPIDGGVASAVLEDSRLFAFDVPAKRHQHKAALRAYDLASGRELWRREGLGTDVLLADHDAVYVSRVAGVLVGLEPATGAPQVEISLAGGFDLSLLAGGGPRGPLLLAHGSGGNDWLLGRGEQPSAPEAYTVRGRLVPDGLSRRQVRGVPVWVGEKLVRSDAAGRFSARGLASGAIAVGVDENHGPGVPGGSTVRFDAVTVVLDGHGTYDLGDVTLYPWYTE